MATLAALVDRCYDYLYGMAGQERPKEDTIDGAFAAGVTTMPVTTDTLWKRDNYAEFETDGEIVICAADGTGGNVTVRRGQRGTTDATQTSGDVIFKNPLFPRHTIEGAINEIVDLELWDDVWTWEKASLTFVDGDHLYDLSQYIEEVVLMYQFNLNSDNKLHPLDREWWDTELQINTAVTTNSNLLRIRKVIDSDVLVYYTAKRRPSSADLANISSEIEAIIPWGAVAKLLTSRAVPRRYDPSHQTRDEAEGGEFRDYRGFMSEFLRLRNQLNRQLRTEVGETRVFRPVGRRGRW